MSWLRNGSFRASLNKRISNSPPKDADPTACYESFRKHWQQANEIIQRTQASSTPLTQDDVLGVVNHLDHMVTLLLMELRTVGSLPNGSQDNSPSSGPELNVSCPSLEFLLSENLLEKLYTWSEITGRYSNAVRLQQLKLYEQLVSHSRLHLLSHEPFLRPLLMLLSSSAREVFPFEVEKKLVVLLYQLCIALMQNVQLLDLFFSLEEGKTNFVLFQLLIPFVHREEGIGQQARDALLLCMSLSKKNKNVAQYITQHSNVCPVLATGLSGLYSLLPRKLVVDGDDWHQLTPDDVTDLPELASFMNSLEFCNAVVQVAHPLIKTQMLEFLYQGFLVPVMGPALLQESVGLCDEQIDTALDASTIEDLTAATAYLELFIRSVSDPGLLCSFVRFLLEDKFDGERILDHLVQRINSKTRLGVVTLSLLDSLVSLYCEDVMLELVFRHLVPCSHVMVSQRRRVRDRDPYCRNAERFLSLAPLCCNDIPTAPPSLPPNVSPSPNFGNRPRASSSCDTLSSLPTTTSLYGLRHSESLYANYHAYLCDARAKIQACASACSKWVYPYDGESPPYEAFCVPRPEKRVESPLSRSEDKQASSSSNGDSDVLSSLETVNIGEFVSTQGRPEKQSNAESSENSDANAVSSSLTTNKEEKSQSTANDSSLPSIGESSGYESFALKFSSDSSPENEPLDDTAATLEDGLPTSITEAEVSKTTSLLDSKVDGKCVQEGSYMDVFKTTPNIGPFLDAILRKLEGMLDNGLVVNLQLTGLISRLAVHPHPLLRSFLLDHLLVTQPSIRSLFQVLGTLKHRIDRVLSGLSNIQELVIEAQEFLVNREDRLTNARRLALEASAPGADSEFTSLPPNTHHRNSLTNDPFARGDGRRRSLTSTVTSLFRRAAQVAQPIREQLESAGETGSYRYYHRSITAPKYDDSKREDYIRNVVLCAVILDEWLKELAAIAQEHSVYSAITEYTSNNARS
ncbi:FHIP family protein GF15501 isoform X2 [Frankliniella occidentalis]|uniref:FHIP family protein GF15501 isoform X2 n=1 Tax=Frankliniella occidentalis TaxID=133901 RepID=A0A6J1SDQ3_FRAOC|nr:FHIP family protein GF15501 isoform X2 [Frankliniella occidentalis]